MTELTPAQELAQANAIARMYPICVQGAGSCTVNGKTYYWNYKTETMELPPKPERKKKL